MQKGKFIKLKSGAWGGWFEHQSAPNPGDSVEIVTKAGKVQVKTVAKVIWSQGLKSIVSFRESDSGRSRSRGRNGRCVDCGGPVVDAPHHRAMEGYCGSCAFDEFDM